MEEALITAERLNWFIARNPFNRWLGLGLRAIREDGVELVCAWRAEFVSNPDRGNVHGGVLAALIDTAGSYAIAVKAGRPVPTIDMRVDYHKPAMPGDLIVTGRIIRLGGTLSTAEATITSAEGQLLTSGRGAYFMAPRRAPEPEQKTHGPQAE